MSYKMSESIMRTVISNEFEKYAEEHSHEWKELASEYAVEMLVKIRDILNENISLDDCYKKIMNVILFLDEPPYKK